MNPDTNKFENLETSDELEAQLKELQGQQAELYSSLVRPDGSPVPRHWSVFQHGEEVVVKNYTFKVAYINESTLILEPVGVPIVGDSDT